MKAGVALSIVGLLAALALTSGVENQPDGRELANLVVAAVSVAPGVLVAAVGGLLVRRGFAREERTKPNARAEAG